MNTNNSAVLQQSAVRPQPARRVSAEGIGTAAGRALLAAIFVFSALGKLGSFEQTAGYMASKGMPLAPLFLAGAIGLELFGGLSVLLGYRARLGALALVVFLIPATMIFHNFWTIEGMQRQMQMAHFMKNVAILGALLLVICRGAGAYSIDAWRTRRSQT